MSDFIFTVPNVSCCGFIVYYQDPPGCYSPLQWCLGESTCSDGSSTAPSLSDSIMGVTSVLTDSALHCATATAFPLYVCKCLCMLGPCSSNFEQKTLSVQADERCNGNDELDTAIQNPFPPGVLPGLQLKASMYIYICAEEKGI